MLCVGVLATLSLWATHNRAGEITYEQIDDLTIRIKITTYTQTSSVAADRDSLLVFWGDGTSEYVFRTNGSGNGVPLENNIKLNIYEANHTYPARATYTVGFMDRNRVANILNVNAPNSIEVPFYVQTTFTFLSSQFQGRNSSAQLLQPPVDIACVGQPYIHNPNAYDIDGDSLAYRLGIPAMTADMNVPVYQFPDQIVPGPTNNISLDPITGDFVWDNPKLIGQYNIAIIIDEYRNGQLINSIVRDMQIRVENCIKESEVNRPPSIDAPTEICVIAGETIEVNIPIGDPNVASLVQVSATGGPFLQAVSPATFTTPNQDYAAVPSISTFRWETTCEHVSKFGYQVIFKAQDLFCDEPSLTTLHTLQIKVVAPPPENLESESASGGIALTWDLPYDCMNESEGRFRGFSVWRKLSTGIIDVDSCGPSLDGSDYSIIEFITNDNNGISYTYLDTEVEAGETYCYRVQAELASATSSGQLFNFVESLPSNETCRQLNRDLPLITEVSVMTTDIVSGSIDVSYLTPLVAELDTVVNPGPYRFDILRSPDGTNYQVIPSASTTLNVLIDGELITYTDTGLDTRDLQYFYRIELSTGAGGDLYGSSVPASSPFLSLLPSDRSITLSVDVDVPWSNFVFDIFRRDPGSASLDSITSTTTPSYRDVLLTNGETYCYVVRTRGSYGLEDVPSPLLNLSQEVCAVPEDDQPPCPPVLVVESVCDMEINGIDLDDLFNTLSWNNPDEDCNLSDDIAGYNIYYSPFEDEDKELIAVADDEDFITYVHNLDGTVAGCYEVTAYDLNGNESMASNEVCIDNCPAYELPNTFTPNGDISNDLFVPRVNRFIDEIDLKVYNRWGNLVYETTDPSINWDGNTSGGAQLAEGVYYYTCRVVESRVFGSGEQQRLLRGNITIIR